MRFLGVLKGTPESEAGTPPPPELFAKMADFMEEVTKAGVLLATEGLHPSSKAKKVITSGGKDQIAIWHAQALSGLDPATGKLIWTVGLEPSFGMAIMAPRQHGDRLYAAGIGGAGVVLQLEGEKVKTIWQEGLVKGNAFAPKPRGLYPVNMTPFIDNGIIYGVDQPGMLRAKQDFRQWRRTIFPGAGIVCAGAPVHAVAECRHLFVQLERHAGVRQALAGEQKH